MLTVQQPLNTARPVEETGKLHPAWLETPLGRMLAVADDVGVHLLEFADCRALPGEIKRFQERFRSLQGGRNEVIELLAQELAEYFSGTSGTFNVRTVQHGTAFEEKVWAALKKIPLGETRSYGELARLLGCPDATRAVGRANGVNQIAIVVPCHRVIGSDGSMVGYGGKLWRKKWLLQHEQRLVSKLSGNSLENFLET
jgi:AraC family transcriptional regulator of adaptative response/methylated-DNA-[protein]-cysteine methyltransferase